MLRKQAGLLQHTRETKKQVFNKSTSSVRDLESPRVLRYFRTVETLQVGKSLTLGGRSLRTPRKNLETRGSCPTGNPVLGLFKRVEETALL
jgi:hypothetical protein